MLRSWGLILGVVLGCDKSAPNLTSPTSSELFFEGRFDTSAETPRFEWPDSAIWLRFNGTGAKVVLGEQSLEHDEYGQQAHDWFDVTVDGQAAQPIKLTEGKGTYLLASGLPAGEHQIILRKRTEAYVGRVELHGFELDHGSSLLPVKAPGRRIEFIGDSIAAGFGIDGAGPNCLFSAETENSSEAYAALTAQALGAQQMVVAASGAGVYRNWGGTTSNTISDLYGRTLPTDPAARWDFSRWTPDVVVIDVGTGDFTSGDPGRDAFVGGYRKLIAQVRQNYPSVLIVIGVGPMLSDLWPAGARALTQGRSYVADLTAQLVQAGDTRIKLMEFPNQDHAATFGCKSHPSAATQRQMADQLIAFLRQQLGW
jgi:hypothetical protein